MPAELPNKNVFTFLSVIGEMDVSYKKINQDQATYQYSYNKNLHTGSNMDERMAATRSQDKATIDLLNSLDNAVQGPVDRGPKVSKTLRKAQTADRSYHKRGNKSGADVRDSRHEDDENYKNDRDKHEEREDWLNYVDDLFNDCGYVIGGFGAARGRVKFV